MFDEAKAYETPNSINGNTFYWNGNESLEELEGPERMAQIRENWEVSRARARKNLPNQKLVQILGYAEPEDEPQGCLICQL